MFQLQAGQAILQPLCNAGRRLTVCIVQQHKLFPAITGHQIRRRAYRTVERLCRLLETNIPHLMTLVVVKALEIVHIDQDERERCAAFLAMGQRTLQLDIEMPSVGNTGQGILLGEQIKLPQQRQIFMFPHDRQLKPAVQHAAADFQHQQTAHKTQHII